MGKDYRHKVRKTERFEDGYEMFKNRKLDSYDRNKARKQNKINLNHFSTVEDDFEYDANIEDVQTEEE